MTAPKKNPAPKKNEPTVVSIDRAKLYQTQIMTQATEIATLQTELLYKQAIIDELTNPSDDKG